MFMKLSYNLLFVIAFFLHSASFCQQNQEKDSLGNINLRLKTFVKKENATGKQIKKISSDTLSIKLTNFYKVTVWNTNKYEDSEIFLGIKKKSSRKEEIDNIKKHISIKEVSINIEKNIIKQIRVHLPGESGYFNLVGDMSIDSINSTNLHSFLKFEGVKYIGKYILITDFLEFWKLSNKKFSGAVILSPEKPQMGIK